MPTLEEIRAVGERVNRAREALLDYIASPNPDPSISRNALLAELSDAQNQFMELIHERIRQQE